MKNVLIVEESSTLAKTFSKKINFELGLPTKIAASLNEVKVLVQDGNHDFFIAIVDISRGNLECEKIIDLISSRGLSSILITGEFSEKMSEWMLSRHIIDYVVKEESWDFDYIMRMIHRVYKNQFIKVLVADDSQILRLFIKKLLTIQKYMVIEAKDGVEALEQLKKNPDIKLIITDFQMPRMDGFKLTAQVRKTFHFNQLAIVGISAHGSGLFSAKFLKKGANDFLTKPFVNEEFNCRINQNIDMLEYIEAVKQASNRDYLTGFYNRRYFFDLGNRHIQNLNGVTSAITVAMMDIDYFKSINDQYGHQAGDRILQHVSRVLSENFSDADIVCRFGGDEFCVFSTRLKKAETKRFFEGIRKCFEKEKVNIGEASVSLTLSFGVVDTFSISLEATIQRADELLYQAKKSGRNRVVIGS
ncbi:MAG: diguanylate cyclase [Candidatus Aminicenantes bacterium]|nr:diguanylate cyclase [Candidatus Aminicenantes bacterium]